MSNSTQEHFKERLKWETAIEMGLGGKALKRGWAGLTAQETGKIGGIVARKLKTKSKGQ